VGNVTASVADQANSSMTLSSTLTSANGSVSRPVELAVKGKSTGTRRSLGAVLRQRRRSLGLTQVELSKRLKVKPSYVGFLESDRRRPSLPLLSRLANTLELKPEVLFLLAHPEEKELLGMRRRSSQVRDDEAWRGFKANKRLLARYGVKPKEFKVLLQVKLLGKVSAPRDFFYILNTIRQALQDEK